MLLSLNGLMKEESLFITVRSKSMTLLYSLSSFFLDRRLLLLFPA